MKITKKGLVDIVKEKTDLSKKDVEKVINTIISTIIEEVKNGNEIQITGFGKFYPKNYKRCNVINPRTGQVLGDIEKRLFKFKVSNRIKHI